LRKQLEPLADRKVESEPHERAILLIAAWTDATAREFLSRDAERGDRLGKRFGGTEGHKYVNGVLDKLAKTFAPMR
jgi:N utilization substance protein B